MANTRLTQTIRKEILDAAMKNAYLADEKQIDDKMRDLSERIYYALVTPEQEKAMNKLPHGFFNLSSAKSARLRETSNGSYRYIQLKFAKERRLPAFCSGYNDIDLTDRALYDAYIEIERQEKALGEKRQKLETEISAVLSSANTVQKLLDVWPEAKPFIPAYVFAPKAALPAIVTGKLNELLKQARPELAAAA